MAPLKFKLEDLPQPRHHLRHFRADSAIRFRAVHTAGRPKDLVSHSPRVSRRHDHGGRMSTTTLKESPS